MEGENNMNLEKAMSNIKGLRRKESEKLGKLVENKQVKETKKLTELRHVDKKVIVKGYDFKELAKEIQDELIRKQDKRKGRKSTLEEIKKQTVADIAEEAEKNIKEQTIISVPTVSYSMSGSIHENNYLYEGEINDTPLEFFSKLSEKIELNDPEGYYAKVKLNARFYSDWGINYEERILSLLRDETNYRELEKADKREILLKLKTEVEKATKIIDEANAKVPEELENIEKETQSSLGIINNKTIKELSEFWYTENGCTIIEKSKAKVVGNVNESLLTEAPVDLEFDRGYDVYSYDDLDNYAKSNAFNSTERARKNEYERRFPELQDKIFEATLPVFKKVGLEVTPPKTDGWSNGTGCYSLDKGYLTRVDYVITPESLTNYIKANNVSIDLEQNKISFAYVRVELNNNYNRYNFSFVAKFDDVGYSDSVDGYKDLRKEVELDLEGIVNKITRIEKQFKQEIDDDFKNRLSTDRKFKRREYDSRGNIYKKKDHPEDK